MQTYRNYFGHRISNVFCFMQVQVSISSVRWYIFGWSELCFHNWRSPPTCVECLAWETTRDLHSNQLHFRQGVLVLLICTDRNLVLLYLLMNQHYGSLQNQKTLQLKPPQVSILTLYITCIKHRHFDNWGFCLFTDWKASKASECNVTASMPCNHIEFRRKWRWTSWERLPRHRCSYRP